MDLVWISARLSTPKAIAVPIGFPVAERTRVADGGIRRQCAGGGAGQNPVISVLDIPVLIVSFIFTVGHMTAATIAGG